MRIRLDPEASEASFDLDKRLYGEEALRIAAHVFEKRADAFVEPARDGSRRVTLAAKRKGAELDLLAREFLNEALNHEYRARVSALNGKLAAMLVTQALYSARGSEDGAAPPWTPEDETEAARWMQEAREEAERTMPKRIPPQGVPIAPEEAATDGGQDPR